MNGEAMLLDALGGMVQANLPEIVGTAGVYVTFRDQKYVYNLMLDQVKESGLFNSIVGAAMPLVLPMLSRFKKGKNNNNNNNNNNRRRNKRQNKKNK